MAADHTRLVSTYHAATVTRNWVFISFQFMVIILDSTVLKGLDFILLWVFPQGLARISLLSFCRMNEWKEKKWFNEWRICGPRNCPSSYPFSPPPSLGFQTWLCWGCQGNLLESWVGEGICLEFSSFLPCLWGLRTSLVPGRTEEAGGGAGTALSGLCCVVGELLPPTPLDRIISEMQKPWAGVRDLSFSPLFGQWLGVQLLGLKLPF